MADSTEPKEKPRRLHQREHLALAAKFPRVKIADPKGFASAMHRASIHFSLLRAANTPTLNQTRKQLSPMVRALEKLRKETEAEGRTAAQRRAISFARAAAGKKGLGDSLADFLDFLPEAEKIFRDALNADADEVDFDITHGESNEPLLSLVRRLVKIHGKYVAAQISENEFVLWALGPKFSEESVRKLRQRAAIKNN